MGIAPGALEGKNLHYICSTWLIVRSGWGSVRPRRLSSTFWGSSGIVTQRRCIVRWLTTLTPKQAEYLGLHTDGPYKPGHYRY
ncbi:MAG: adenosylhomocysteinase [Planctomycetota bacterium]